MARSHIVRWAGQGGVWGHSTLRWQVEGARGDAVWIHDGRTNLSREAIMAAATASPGQAKGPEAEGGKPKLKTREKSDWTQETRWKLRNIIQWTYFHA